MPRDHFLRPALQSPAGAQLHSSGGSPPIATTLELAGDSATRRQGLLGRDGLAPGEALIVAPTFAIHTFGMRFPIDVIFAARDGLVLKVVRALAPRRIAWAPRAFAAIELAAGGAGAVSAGDRLRVEARPR